MTNDFTGHFAHPSLRWGNKIYSWLEERKHPVLQLAYPKELRVPQGYTDPRFFTFQCYASALLMRTEPDAATNKTLVCAYTVNNALIRYQVPTFFIGGDLLCAVAASDAPEDMPVSQLNWPAKALLLMLPMEQSKQVVNGHEVIYISMCRVASSFSTQAPFDIDLPEGGTMPARGVDIQTHEGCDEYLMMNSIVVDRDGTPAEYHAILPITGAKVKDWLVYDIKFYPFALSPHLDFPFDEKIDGAVAERLKQIAIQTLLAFNAAPELFEREAIIKPAKKNADGKVIRRALWAPNFIGRTYVLPRAKSSGEGHHASPRAHYRRGHFRNQRHGPGNELRKLIWLQPVFVGV